MVGMGRGQRTKAWPSVPKVRERSHRWGTKQQRLDLEMWKSQRPCQDSLWWNRDGCSQAGEGDSVSGEKEMRIVKRRNPLK